MGGILGTNVFFQTSSLRILLQNLSSGSSWLTTRSTVSITHTALKQEGTRHLLGAHLTNAGWWLSLEQQQQH
jgi:hypothetical protein